MKIAVSIPDPLFKRAERAAKRSGISRSQFYQRALSVFLDQRNERAIIEALNAVYDADPEAGRLDPFFEALQNEVLSQEKW